MTKDTPHLMQHMFQTVCCKSQTEYTHGQLYLCTHKSVPMEYLPNDTQQN